MSALPSPKRRVKALGQRRVIHIVIAGEMIVAASFRPKDGISGK